MTSVHDMYVYMCVYIYMCIYIYMYVYIYIYIHMLMIWRALEMSQWGLRASLDGWYPNSCPRIGPSKSTAA